MDRASSSSSSSSQSDAINYSLETFIQQKKYLTDKRVLKKMYKLVAIDYRWEVLSLKEQNFLAHYPYISNVVYVKESIINYNFYGLPFDIALMKKSRKNAQELFFNCRFWILKKYFLLILKTLYIIFQKQMNKLYKNIKKYFI